MGTIVVEDFDEAVEPGLLLHEVPSGGLGGFFLQREMHAFMAAILLGMARLDPFNTDAQSEPPDRELATELAIELKRNLGHAANSR